MKKHSSGTRARPKLVAPSEEMKRISALLSEELLQWPAVSVRPMFGLRAAYRGAAIFAMLPAKRALESPTAIACKLPGGTEQRREGEKWRLFELDKDRSINDALACLQKAYKRAGK